MRWIDVKDGLPHDGDLVYPIKINGEVSYGRCSQQDWNKGYWYILEELDCYTQPEITHWMDIHAKNITKPSFKPSDGWGTNKR